MFMFQMEFQLDLNVDDELINHFAHKINPLNQFYGYHVKFRLKFLNIVAKTIVVICGEMNCNIITHSWIVPHEKKKRLAREKEINLEVLLQNRRHCCMRTKECNFFFLSDISFFAWMLCTYHFAHFSRPLHHISVHTAVRSNAQQNIYCRVSF